MDQTRTEHAWIQGCNVLFRSVHTHPNTHTHTRARTHTVRVFGCFSGVYISEYSGGACSQQRDEGRGEVGLPVKRSEKLPTKTNLFLNLSFLAPCCEPSFECVSGWRTTCNSGTGSTLCTSVRNPSAEPFRSRACTHRDTTTEQAYQLSVYCDEGLASLGACRAGCGLAGNSSSCNSAFGSKTRNCSGHPTHKFVHTR